MKQIKKDTSRRREFEAEPGERKKVAAPARRASSLVTKHETHAMKNAAPRRNARRLETCAEFLDTQDTEVRKRISS